MRYLNQTKVLFVIMMAILMTSAAFAKINHTQPKQTVPLNRIAAIVNNDVITQTKLDEQIEQYKKHLKSIGVSIPKMAVLKQDALEQMINKRLQLQIIQRTGVTINDTELNQILQNIAQNRQMTVETLFQTLQQEGWSKEAFKKEIREEALINQLQKHEVASKIIISDEAIDQFLLSGQADTQRIAYHITDILIPLTENPSVAVRQKADQIAQTTKNNLQRGKPLPKNVKQTDLGWKKLNELPTIFTPFVASTQEKAILGPIEAPNGFHILNITDIQKGEARQIKTKVELQEIVIAPNGDAKKTSEHIQQALQKGQDFGRVARQYSSDRQTAEMSGYVGWVAVDELDPAIQQAVNQLSVGQMNTQPIPTEKGSVIVKILAKKHIPQATEAERQAVTQFLYQRQIEEDLEKFLIDLRNESYIKIIDDNGASQYKH